MNRLLLFAKEPQQAKQRLRASLPSGMVTKLASAFLRDTLQTVSLLEDVTIQLAYTPRSSEPKFSGFMDEFGLNEPHGLTRQRGRALGARLEAAIGDAFESGSERVVAIGMDSPSMPLDSIRSGFVHLRDHDCVLGPTLDGGYYLIGLSRPCPALFRGIEWSTGSVYRQTVEIVHREKLSYRELPVWYDIDTAEDIEFLVRDINQFRLAGDEERAQYTESVLANILQVDS